VCPRRAAPAPQRGNPRGHRFLFNAVHRISSIRNAALLSSSRRSGCLAPPMQNLLHSAPPENELAAILAATAGRPPLPPPRRPVSPAARDNPALTSRPTPLTTLAPAARP